MKILILSMFLIPNSDTINIQNLENSLIEFYNFKTQSEIIEFSQNEKLGFLKYLPIPSVVNRDGYHLEFSFSVTQIYAYANDKAKRKQTIVSIEKRNKIELKRELQELRNEIEIWKNMLIVQAQMELNLETEKRLLEIETQLYEIDKSKYERNEISTSNFLQVEKSFILSKSKFQNINFGVLQFEIDIQNQKSKIYKIAKTL